MVASEIEDGLLRNNLHEFLQVALTVDLDGALVNLGFSKGFLGRGEVDDIDGLGHLHGLLSDKNGDSKGKRQAKQVSYRNVADHSSVRIQFHHRLVESALTPATITPEFPRTVPLAPDILSLVLQ